MKQFRHFSFLFFIGFIFLATNQIKAEENLFFQLDAKQWKLAAKNISDEEAMIELIPNDESILNWSEMLTIQKFPDLNITPEKFIELFSSIASPGGYQSRIKEINPKLNIIENSYIAEKAKETDMIQSEYGLSRALKGEKDLYYIRYATTKEDTFDTVKAAWIEKLAKTSVGEKEPAANGSQWFKFSGDNVYKGGKPLSFEPETVTIEDAKGGFRMDIPIEWDVSSKKSFSHETPQLTILLQAHSPDNQIQMEVFNYASNDAKHKNIDQLISLLDQKGSSLVTALGDKGRYVLLTQGDKATFYALFENPDKVYRIEFIVPKDKIDKYLSQIIGIARNFHIIKQQDKEE